MVTPAARRLQCYDEMQRLVRCSTVLLCLQVALALQSQCDPRPGESCPPNLVVNMGGACTPCPDNKVKASESSVCAACQGANAINTYVMLDSEDCGSYQRNAFCFCKPGFGWDPLQNRTGVESYYWDCVACTGNKISVSTLNHDGVLFSECRDCTAGIGIVLLAWCFLCHCSRARPVLLSPHHHARCDGLHFYAGKIANDYHTECLDWLPIAMPLASLNASAITQNDESSLANFPFGTFSYGARYIGMSLDYWQIPRFFGRNSTHLNENALRLLQKYTSPTGAPPLVRIGGRWTDRSWWNPDRRTDRPFPATIDIVPETILTLAAVHERTGIRFILGMNLAAWIDPTHGATIGTSYLQAIDTHLGWDAVELLEVGNEVSELSTCSPYLQSFTSSFACRQKSSNRS